VYGENWGDGAVVPRFWSTIPVENLVVRWLIASRIAMLNALPHLDWRREGLWVAAFALALAPALDAKAVIVYSSGTYATRNTSPPPADPPVTDQTQQGWNYEFQWGGFLATPIDATHFLGAKHVGLQATSIQVQFPDGYHTLQVNSSSRVDDPGSDLSMFTLQAGYSFPTWAPLYRATVDGSEANKTLTVIGRGTQPGDPLYVNSVKAGWYWGPGDGVQSWGQNKVSGFTAYNGVSSTSLLYFDFDAPGIANEGALSVGDSSGAVFIKGASGAWKLAGINYAVDGPWSLNPDGSSSFLGAIFDARGLYYPNGSGGWSQVPTGYPVAVPMSSYASRISDRLQWIESLIFPGDANLDGAIDVNDLSVVLTNYDRTGMAWAQGDFNGDGTVDLSDLSKVLTGYDTSMASGPALSGLRAVPEPSSAVLLIVSVVGLLHLARRQMNSPNH
jgi:hypothetical protein